MKTQTKAKGMHLGEIRYYEVKLLVYSIVFGDGRSPPGKSSKGRNTEESQDILKNDSINLSPSTPWSTYIL